MKDAIADMQCALSSTNSHIGILLKNKQYLFSIKGLAIM